MQKGFQEFKLKGVLNENNDYIFCYYEQVVFSWNSLFQDWITACGNNLPYNQEFYLEQPIDEFLYMLKNVADVRKRQNEADKKSLNKSNKSNT